LSSFDDALKAAKETAGGWREDRRRLKSARDKRSQYDGLPAPKRGRGAMGVKQHDKARPSRARGGDSRTVHRNKKSR